MRTRPTADAALTALGFSDLEARVYVALLENPDGTGYAVAQRIGKANANTYKAIESLLRKGAVMEDGGEPRCYRAVPAEELITRLEREFASRARDAASALRQVASGRGNERIYQLQGEPAQVLERARNMIDGAERVIVADLFPGPLAALADQLSRAVRRGVEVFVRGYEAGAPSGVRLVLRTDEPALQAWPGQHLGLVRDAREHLFALFNADMTQVQQAVWSASPYLSCLAYNHVAMEWRVVAEATGEKARVPSLIGDKVPGFADLQAAVGGSSPTGSQAKGER